MDIRSSTGIPQTHPSLSGEQPNKVSSASSESSIQRIYQESPRPLPLSEQEAMSHAPLKAKKNFSFMNLPGIKNIAGLFKRAFSAKTSNDSKINSSSSSIHAVKDTVDNTDSPSDKEIKFSNVNPVSLKGKSTALNLGSQVAFLEKEFKKNNIDTTGINFIKIRNGRASGEEWNSFVAATSKLLEIEDKKGNWQLNSLVRSSLNNPKKLHNPDQYAHACYYLKMQCALHEIAVENKKELSLETLNKKFLSLDEYRELFRKNSI